MWSHRLAGTRAASVLGEIERRDVEQAVQHFLLLRSGDGVAAAQNKAGGAVDAQAMGSQIVAMYPLGAFVGGEVIAQPLALQPALQPDAKKAGRR